MKDLFIDIEALGLVPGSAIVQLGAAVFDRDSGEIDMDLQLYLQPEKGDPWTVDLETLEWHGKQGTFPHPPAIREKLALPAGEAIDAFLDWLSEAADAGHEIDDIWSWGADYDFPLLDPYFHRYATGGEAPWAYWQAADARTVWKLAFPGVKHAPRLHHALHDCKAGVADLCAALKKLKGGPGA